MGGGVRVSGSRWSRRGHGAAAGGRRRREQEGESRRDPRRDHANAVEVYSGDKIIPNAGKRGYWNDASTSLLKSTTEQANYLTNNENLVDYMEDTYVDADYTE